MSERESIAFLTEQLRWERAEKDAEIERLRAALLEIEDWAGDAIHTTGEVTCQAIAQKVREVLGHE